MTHCSSLLEVSDGFFFGINIGEGSNFLGSNIRIHMFGLLMHMFPMDGELSWIAPIDQTCYHNIARALCHILITSSVCLFVAYFEHIYLV